jgi:hypothetical protein
MLTDNIPSCNVIGRGKLNKDVSFKIIELSAEKVRIETDAPIEMKSSVSLNMVLDAGLVQIKINANGRVLKKIEKGYEIILTDISDADRNEISELMKSTCDIV